MIYMIVFNKNILYRTVLYTFGSGTSFHADTVVSCINYIVDNQYILATAYINRISILSVPRTFYSDAVDDDIIAAGRNEMEFRRVHQRNTLDKYVLAICEAYQMGA